MAPRCLPLIPLYMSGGGDVFPFPLMVVLSGSGLMVLGLLKD